MELSLCTQTSYHQHGIGKNNLYAVRNGQFRGGQKFGLSPNEIRGGQIIFCPPLKKPVIFPRTIKQRHIFIQTNQ